MENIAADKAEYSLKIENTERWKFGAQSLTVSIMSGANKTIVATADDGHVMHHSRLCSNDELLGYSAQVKVCAAGPRAKRLGRRRDLEETVTAALPGISLSPRVAFRRGNLDRYARGKAAEAS